MSLEVHSFLLPAPLLIQDILYRSALRLARLPQTHPLHTKMKWIERHNVKRHRSALHSLIHTLEVKPSKIETSIPFTLHPGCSPPFYKSIASNDKEAIEDFKKNRDETKVFTDGSSTDGKVGASAVLYVNDTKVATLRFHLGAASEHTIFEAELVGMIMATHLVSTVDNLPLPASIFVDNQAAILAGERPTSKPGHYLSVKFREIVQEVHDRLKLSKNDISVRWIVGHRNIRGNEEADKEAKKAATDENSMSPVDQLPAILKARLPISTSALKQKHREDLLTSWKASWSKSKRYSHLARIDSSTLSKKYLKATGFLPKSRSGVLFQLRSGHIALNKHLYRIKCSDTPNCLQCDKEMPESVHHFLFDCPRYERERHILRCRLSRAAASTADLLGSGEAVTETLKFVRETGRFAQKRGEVQS